MKKQVVIFIISAIVIPMTLGFLTGKCSSHKVSDKDMGIVMASYRKGWIEGANAATTACNYGMPWDSIAGSIQFKKDSVALVCLLNDN